MKAKMKLMFAAAAFLALAFATAFTTVLAAGIPVRDVTFPLGEIPATNPRIERNGATVTHIEVFGPFAEQADGSVRTLVADTSADMDAASAALWVKEARRAVGAAKPTAYSRIRLEIALAQLGLYTQMEQWLGGFEIAPDYTALTAWKSAVVIQDDFPGFADYLAAAIERFGITQAQAEAILAQCVAED